MRAPSVRPDALSVDWYAAHELYVWNRASGATRRIAEVDGVSGPAWSRNGRRLLYVSGDGLWLAPLAAPDGDRVPAVRAEAWRSVGSNDLSYFGQIDWAGQFSWWSP